MDNRAILLVGVGGLIGSILRYLAAVVFSGHTSTGFPLATFTVNLLGCFLIGVIFALSERGDVLSPEWRIFLATGFCGGFTTFSSFSYESIRLMQDGQFLYLGLNVVLSVVLGFAATYLGMILVKAL